MYFYEVLRWRKIYGFVKKIPSKDHKRNLFKDTIYGKKCKVKAATSPYWTQVPHELNHINHHFTGWTHSADYNKHYTVCMIGYCDFLLLVKIFLYCIYYWFENVNKKIAKKMRSKYNNESIKGLKEKMYKMFETWIFTMVFENIYYVCRLKLVLDACEMNEHCHSNWLYSKVLYLLAIGLMEMQKYQFVTVQNLIIIGQVCTLY